MGEAGQAGLSPQVAVLLNPVPSQRARLLLAQGDVGAAGQWAAAAGLSPGDEPDYPREPGYLVLARVLLAQGDPGAALGLLQRLLGAAAQQRSGSGGVLGWERQWERVLLTSALVRFAALACAPLDLRRRTLTEVAGFGDAFLGVKGSQVQSGRPDRFFEQLGTIWGPHGSPVGS